MKTNAFSRILALLLVLCLFGSLVLVPAMAATVDDATIDMDAEVTSKLTPLFRYVILKQKSRSIS